MFANMSEGYGEASEPLNQIEPASRASLQKKPAVRPPLRPHHGIGKYSAIKPSLLQEVALHETLS